MAGDPLLAGFNCKHYDSYVLKAILLGAVPEELHWLSNQLIGGANGWDIPRWDWRKVRVSQYDLMDDCQIGLSLKAIEGHLGMDIRETTIPFDIDRVLTEQECDEVFFYCEHDVDATERLDYIRQNYLQTKVKLGAEKGLSERDSLYATNAKLTAFYLDAARKNLTDEWEIELPKTLNTAYIPAEVLAFFNGLKDQKGDMSTKQFKLMVGVCPVTLALGGIHGAIPNYNEQTSAVRTIRNYDVSSYYPHQVTINGYCSRAIPDPDIYKRLLERRLEAKRTGNTALANALKLVANTTYGAMLNQYNPLYDPRMGRSICIAGQLQLLELATHLQHTCNTLQLIQLNTDGLMFSIHNKELETASWILQEWQGRTGFELEEDLIKQIIQKDVNGYWEEQMDGSTKVKGGYLVRGIAPAGAFNINNNACIVAQAIRDWFAKGILPETTIYGCDDILQFQLIAKAGSTYSNVVQIVDGREVPVQKVNRVYASNDYHNGTLIKINASGSRTKVAGLPASCLIDNANQADISQVDKDWYVRLAWKEIDDFVGNKRKPIRNKKAMERIVNILDNL